MVFLFLRFFISLVLFLFRRRLLPSFCHPLAVETEWWCGLSTGWVAYLCVLYTFLVFFKQRETRAPCIFPVGEINTDLNMKIFDLIDGRVYAFVVRCGAVWGTKRDTKLCTTFTYMKISRVHGTSNNK